MIERIECKVSVEKIGYDYLIWAGKLAKGMGLVGTASIRDDGSLFIIAEGDDEILTKFSKKIQRGHPVFHVFVVINNFSVTWHKPTGEYKDFSITVNKD